MNLDLSIIILSYNTKEITDRCLHNLEKAVEFSRHKLGNKIEVIVVDNASTDGTSLMIKKKYPWVRLISSKVNTGFSGGNNIGMKKSKYPFVLLLNSDCFVGEGTLYDALNYFRKNLSCGVLGCRLILPGGKIQVSFGSLYDPVNTFFWISGLSKLPFMDKIVKPIHPGRPEIESGDREVGWVMGAFFMLKREVWEKTGGFDENIFMYGEEVEWCKRIKLSGYKIFYVPSVKARHLDKASSKGDLSGPFVREIKGILYFMKKYYGGWYPAVLLYMRFFLLLRFVVFSIKGDGVRAKAYGSVLH